MKKLLLSLSLLLCATTSSIFSAFVHTPAIGVTQLGGAFGGVDRSGAIMQIILEHPNFESELATIKSFMGVASTATLHHNYQTIVAKINNAPADMPGAIESLEALERAIMHYLHKYNYIFWAVDNKWINIFVAGIQWPKNLFRNNLVLQQCMQEISLLSQIAEKHSIITSNRMKATVTSYLYWKRTLATTIATYLSANLTYHGWNKSAVRTLKNGGLSNLSVVATQAQKDISNVAQWGYNKILYGSESYSSNIVTLASEKIAQTILYGTNPEVEKKKEKKSFYNDICKHNKNLFECFFSESDQKTEQ